MLLLLDTAYDQMFTKAFLHYTTQGTKLSIWSKFCSNFSELSQKTRVQTIFLTQSAQILFSELICGQVAHTHMKSRYKT